MERGRKREREREYPQDCLFIQWQYTRCPWCRARSVSGGGSPPPPPPLTNGIGEVTAVKTKDSLDLVVIMMGFTKVTSPHQTFKPRREEKLVPGNGWCGRGEISDNKADKVLCLLSPPSLPTLLRSLDIFYYRIIADGPTQLNKLQVPLLPPSPPPPPSHSAYILEWNKNSHFWKIKMRDFMRENDLSMKCPEMLLSCRSSTLCLEQMLICKQVRTHGGWGGGVWGYIRFEL